MAFIRPAGRLHWLLIGPLVLQSALPAAALEAAGKGLDRSAETLLAQAPGPAAAAIPTEVQGWFDAAKEAAAKGDSAEALRLQKQVVAWVQANRPALDVFRARALINLGSFLNAVGQRQEALAPTEEAVRILRLVEGRQPEARRILAMALNNLGISYSELGRRQEALAPTEEALKIYRELAKTNPAFLGDLASSLNNLGIRYSNVGLRQEALAPTEEAVKLYRELAKTNPAFQGDLASSLNNLGISYSGLGRRQEALALVEEAVKIYRELAKTNPAFQGDLARALTNLGKCYSDLDRRQEALATTDEALKIASDLAKANPAFKADLAMALNNLGNHYSDLGRRQEALSPAKEAVKLYLELAKTNPAFLNDLAMAQSNLGASYSELGRRQEALAPTEEALKIRLELAKTNPAFLNDLAMAQSNLGAQYTELGQSRKAINHLKEAVKLYREVVKTYPASLNELATSLDNLGVGYSNLGRHHEALAPSQEAVNTLRQLAKTNEVFLGKLASSLSNLGALYSYLSLQEALPTAEEAVKAYRELAKTNPAFQEALARNAANLAVMNLRLANPSAALPLLKETVSTELTYLQAQLPLLPEGRRLALLDLFGESWQIPFSQALQGEAGAALALFTRLNRQGLLQDIQRSQALLARSGPQRPLFEQLTLVTAQLASTTITPEQQAPLLARKERLEQELYRQLPQIQPRLVEPRQIAALLPAGGALVEFQRYQSLDASQNFGPPRYLALLLRPDGTIRAIPLGEAAPIDAAVAAAVAASAIREGQPEAPEKLAVVSRLVLAPLQRELAGVRELFVSPDGELNRLPFAALPVASPEGGGIADGPIMADGKTLGDAVALRLLTTGRDLLRLQQPAKAGGAPVLIANPDFNAASRSATGGASASATAASMATVTATGSSVLRAGQQRSPGVRGLTAWQPLGGTEQEARQLAPLLGGGAVISGPAATATVVLAQRAPRILHIATHGFFLADQAPASGTATGARSGGTPSEGTAPAAPSREDPLQRSGLVFAGANQPDANPNDDGYLTAAEATAMDLEGTELVTLSACETGLGGVRSGEGVYGLQRSLAVAGARSTLLSLWKVDDNLTVAFMERYYKRLKAGEGRAEALRDTQAEFRNTKISTYNDIRVWGAFQLSGDWRALPKW